MRDLFRAVHAPVRILDRDPGTAGEDVLEMQRSLCGCRVDGLHLEVQRGVGDRLEQFGPAVRAREYVVDQ